MPERLATANVTWLVLTTVLTTALTTVLATPANRAGDAAIWMLFFRLRCPFIVEALCSVKKRHGGVYRVSRCRKANCRMCVFVAISTFMEMTHGAPLRHDVSIA